MLRLCALATACLFLAAYAQAGAIQGSLGALVSPMNTNEDTNICGLKFNYCPMDPGCKGYTMSVHDIKVHDDDATSPLNVSDVTVGSKLTVTVTGITTMSSVPVSGSYRIYALKGGNIASGTLTDALEITTGGNFKLTAQFAVTDALFGGSKQLFEFGLDVFQQGSGSDEGMCIQVESEQYVEQVKQKLSPPFDFMCKDNGDGHFDLLPSPVPIVAFDVAAPTCLAPTPAPTPAPATLQWYYCPRDPGCKTYTMSVESVKLADADNKGYAAGDHVKVLAKGSTTLKSIPPSGTYRVYSMQGHNTATGLLSSVMTLAGGKFSLEIPFILPQDSFFGDDFEFGIDVFQDKSGTNEGMCIEVASPAYITQERLKLSPPFVAYCTDLGGGHFKSTMPQGTPEVTQPVPIVPMARSLPSWISQSSYKCPTDMCSCCPKNPDGSAQCPCLCGGGDCPRCCQ